jgi:peptidyl-prolyl cis-trans isomerase C
MLKNKGMRSLAGILLCSLMLFSRESIGAESERTIAKVGNETITESQVKKFSEGASPTGAGMNESDAVQELIVRSVLYQEAKKRGVNKRKNVQEQIENNERNIVIQALIKEESLSNEPVTEEVAKDLYDKNWMDSRYPRWVKLTLFRVSYKDKGLAKKAEEYAASVRSKIRNEEFDKDPEKALKQLKTESPPPDGVTIDATQYKKIFLLKFRQSRIDIEQVPLKLKEGETSEVMPVPQNPQFALINLTKEYPKEEVRFDKVKSELMMVGSQLRQKEKINAYFEKIKGSYEIEFPSK